MRRLICGFAGRTDHIVGNLMHLLSSNKGHVLFDISLLKDKGAIVVYLFFRDSFAEIYVKPWCRIGPYVVGFFTGYVLYKTECKLRIPKVII